MSSLLFQQASWILLSLDSLTSEIFKDFFACKIVFAANHENPGYIQRLSRLQNCLNRKSSIPWKNSKTFSPAKMSSPQIIKILEKFKEFIDCKIAFAANHQYPGKIQKQFRLPNCLSRKSSISRSNLTASHGNYSKTIPNCVLAKLNCVSSKTCWKNSKLCHIRKSIASNRNHSQTLPNCVLADFTCISSKIL